MNREEMRIDKLRPWLSDDGKSYYTDAITRKAVESTSKATLTAVQWLEVDAIVATAFPSFHRSSLVQYLLRKGLRLDLDGLKQSYLEDEVNRTDSTFNLTLYPLPFVWKDVQLGDDWQNNLEQFSGAASRCAELTEQIVLGVAGADKHTPYGLLSHPGRTSYQLSGNYASDLMTMKRKLIDNGFSGPFLLVCNDDSEEVDPWLSLETKDCGWETTSHYLCPKGRVCLFQETVDVIRMVVGLKPVAVQWPDGSFRVLSIMCPQIRTDCDGNVGIVEGGK